MLGNKEQMLALRGQLIKELRQELLGPGSECLYNEMDIEHEIITDLPEARYSVGVLYPQGNTLNVGNDDVLDPDDPSKEVDETEAAEAFAPVVDEISLKKTPEFVSDDSGNFSLDDAVGLSTQAKPSSMGVTFFVKGNIKSIKFNLSFATYRVAKVSDCVVPYKNLCGEVNYLDSYAMYENELLKLKTAINRKTVKSIEEKDNITDRNLIDALYKLANQCGKKAYVREAHKLSVYASFDDGDYNDLNENLAGRSIKLVVMRRVFKDDIYAITALLVNTACGAYNGKNSIFQPEISVSSLENNFIFERYDNIDVTDSKDEEEKSLALLYRHKKVFATGHGVSADWDIDLSGNGNIKTEFLPVGIVRQMDFDLDGKDVERQALSMKYLSDLNDDSIEIKAQLMMQVLMAYKNWINTIGDDIERESDTLDILLKEKAFEHIEGCKESLERMIYGINLLKTNENLAKAFQLANRAMYMQRIHGEMQKKDCYPNDDNLQAILRKLNYYNEIDQYQWRPFQLAFLLMSLRSIVEPEYKERDLVDLIWFPTGGGKTEAYLGLTALTIFYRKLTYPVNAGGTNVIMRYTLRLLAAQQFVRASILICACEAIRKDCRARISKYPKYNLGEEAITIGLWIGGDHTPNKNKGSDDHKGAKEYLDELYKADQNNLKYNKDRYNKFQVLKCPWCGTKMVKDSDEKGNVIGDWGYKIRDGKHFFLACPQEDCKFQSKLPIQIVDEELYSNPPTLLFGTVDKFAMITWKSESGSFFAVGSDNRCPELIIQDELHLISGPLGTIVGLYETAIDALCCHKGVKPKIIASTATIRRAKEQCRNLYNREVSQFPSPGINAEDSFFAREADDDKKPGRLYFGIMPSGKTKAMMEVRVISSILQRINMMNYDYETKDKFWTIATYFNSLRDLGGCSTRVDDDVKDFIRRIALRLGTRKDTRIIGSAEELTSRISTTQLNETLEKLENTIYSEANQKAKKYPISVLLATNMISVGVDVARLNVMVIIGQPKLTSEYIQASSRIGRSYPGAAFILYDASKSRDRSHYEQFKPYHESFYRYVEPTSVTPFSKPARERALHSVQVSLMRHLAGLSRDIDARYFDKEAVYLKEIETFILERIDSIRKNSTLILADENDVIENELKEFWNEWEERIALTGSVNSPLTDKDFCYGDKYMVKRPDGDAKRLIKIFGTTSQDKARETLTSMRNVDKNVAVRLLVWGDKND
ncbi:helicase-related protein [Pelosinus sp. sgz500959]|uniref:helicase-related protein n=1 Tax=Pelosinus sp. sgz500959 TaxID=3242472 RepID=UPI003671E294